MHAIIETPTFLKDAAGVPETDRLSMIDKIARNPKLGIPGTGGARKVRFPGRGKGKSAGYRVITYFPANTYQWCCLPSLVRASDPISRKLRKTPCATDYRGLPMNTARVRAQVFEG